MKFCGSCKKEKDLDCFYRNSSTKDKHCFLCKSCHNAATQRWRVENPRRLRSQYLKYHFNISLEDYERLMNQQNNRCAICLIEFSVKKQIHVDHCHQTGKVRGLLCQKCNQALGLLHERVYSMQRMINYMEASSVQRPILSN